MIKTGDGEHAQQIGDHCHQYGNGTDTHPDDGETHNVHADKGNHSRPFNAILSLVYDLFRSGIGNEPVLQSQ